MVGELSVRTGFSKGYYRLGGQAVCIVQMLKTVHIATYIATTVNYHQYQAQNMISYIVAIINTKLQCAEDHGMMLEILNSIAIS